MKGNFSKLIKGSQPVLVDFYADWCGPCQMQAPILKEVAQEIGKTARIVKIDVDKNQAVASRYNVRSIPTLMIFKNGKQVWKHSGVAQKNQLLGLLRQHA